MSTPRAYVDLPLASGTQVELPEAVAIHAVRVLRLRAGDALTLFNGRGGEFAATLGAAAGRGRVRAEVGAHDDIERESPLRVTLLQAVARGERMDLIVQKATELGVARIVPLASERSVVRLDERQAAKRLEHWRGIAIAACEQCGRNRLPQIDPVADFDRIADSRARPRARRRDAAAARPRRAEAARRARAGADERDLAHRSRGRIERARDRSRRARRLHRLSPRPARAADRNRAARRAHRAAGAGRRPGAVIAVARRAYVVMRQCAVRFSTTTMRSSEAMVRYRSRSESALATGTLSSRISKLRV